MTHELVVLVDIASYIADNNIIMTVVNNGNKLVCVTDLVGIQTQQLAQSQGIFLDKSIIINRVHYNKQQYVYCNEQLYEVKTLGKAKKSTEMILNVSSIDDSVIEQAILEWLGDN